MKKFSIGVLGLILPSFAFAATQNLNQLINYIDTLIRVVIPILIGLGILVLLWGIVKFVMSAGDEDARAEGKQLMIWGVVGIFVMVAVWGLVNFLVSTAGLNTTTIGAPTVPGSQNPLP